MIETHFHDNKVAKVKTPDKFFSLIKLESILRTKGNSYFLHVFPEECKYDVKNIKRNRQIDYNQIMNDKSDNEPDSGTDNEPDIDPDDNNESDNNESEKSSKKSD